ncbi:hypothetical protein BKA67DRAFT_523746 [Truncatella angustata]|uniref:CID domain-containing protein n=1 Tax=Truncatella angustata TaxID=152316 RepID=A0A9P8RPZ3_9PEZI|nr:uncharacterized protein BKA67DRAFT_523746 [Truncatella angustata]KAH6647597.1 hypothetical protein BKA67DRAFT_523746 [Truncatella angustata]
MSSSSKKVVESFPDVEAKLQKAHKQSAFDKERADREAKRKREAAETAAVYESFVKSFDNEDDDDDEISAIARGGQGAPFNNRSQGPGRGGFAPVPGPGKRHFGTGLKSGPGSLGPGPPTGYGRNRGFDESYRRDDASRGRLGRYEDDREYDPTSRGISKAFNTSDDEAEGRTADRAEDRAVAKPTLRLANLPPRISPAVIKALIPPNLNVESVKILPPAPSAASERKSMTSIVILSPDTAATDIDAAVSSLQNRYLGFGFYLSLHRHLSSAVAATTVSSSLVTTASSHPFGAKPVAQPEDQNRNQQTQFHRGFAPPTSYGPPSGGPLARAGLFHVPIQAPRDIKQLQLIHKVIESVLEHGPEFEALLMSRPDVQREEKWAWLWDARSEGGVWYRWRLWEVITGLRSRGGKPGKYVPLFEGSHAWKTPEKPLMFEYATNISEFVSDSEYNSSDEEDYEDEGNKPNDSGPGNENEHAYLNPLDKAKLVHLLVRLPATLGRIRKGDIARITTFAITHASRGADEIVELIVSNIQKPFGTTAANPESKQSVQAAQDMPPRGQDFDPSTPIPDDKEKQGSNEQVDTSPASLVGLYVVSDILSSSATSGVRHSWRYRQLFESALRDRKIFEYLGQTAERIGWGRLRADKWKRSVGLILSLWEGWCVFPAESQELFVKSFENPPSLASSNNSESQQVVDAAEAEKKAGGRWKTVEAGNDEAHKGFKPVSIEPGSGYDPSAEKMDVDDELDGEAMDDDLGDDMLMDSDIDGKPMSEDEAELDEDPMDEDTLTVSNLSAPTSLPQQGDEATTKPVAEALDKEERPVRRRMRAVDMFADDTSDKER